MNVDVAMDARGAEQHRSRDLIEVDDPTLVALEFQLHRCVAARCFNDPALKGVGRVPGVQEQVKEKSRHGCR